MFFSSSFSQELGSLCTLTSHSPHATNERTGILGTEGSPLKSTPRYCLVTWKHRWPGELSMAGAEARGPSQTLCVFSRRPNSPTTSVGEVKFFPVLSPRNFEVTSLVSLFPPFRCEARCADRLLYKENCSLGKQYTVY